MSSDPLTCPVTWLLSANVTLTWVAEPTTCALVTITPFAS